MNKFINILINAYFLAIREIKIKYVRTYMGPLWIPITTIFIAFVVSIVWSLVFQINFLNYFFKIYICLATWNFIIAAPNEGCELFSKKFNKILSNSNISILNYVFFNLFSLVIIYLHNLPFFLIFMFFIGSIKILNILFFIVGIIILLSTMFSIIFIIGTFSARFRDIAPLVKTLTAPLMLLTPVIWDKEQLGRYSEYIYLNPFTSLIEIITNPLLDKSIDFKPYLISIILMIVGIILTIIIYKKFKKKIVFWSN